MQNTAAREKKPQGVFKHPAPLPPPPSWARVNKCAIVQHTKKHQGGGQLAHPERE